MSSSTAHRGRAGRGIAAAVLGGALALSFAVPAFAVEAPAEPIEAATAARSGETPETTFTPDLQTEIFIADESMPNDFVSSADGTTGYVTSRGLNEFTIIDMQTRTVSSRIETPGTGGDDIRLSADGTLAYYVIMRGAFPAGIGVIDLTSGTFLKEFTEVTKNIQQLELSRDGASLYALGLEGEVVHLDAVTGEELGRARVAGMNAHGLLLIAGDSKLLVGIQNTVFTLDATTLEQLDVATFNGISGIASLRIDTTEERVYFADSSGTALGVFNPATGAEIDRIAVGSPMHFVVGDDANNRAFGNVPYWKKLMAADYTAGVRSESFRDTPNAPFSIQTNPVTGELLAANAGWSNADKGSTVTIVNAPSVSDPSDVEITALGETVRFETNAVGIKRGNGGGIAWQSSSDGETWADIEGAMDEQVDIEVTPETVRQQFRVRWADDFWGRSGASAPASIVAPAPAITFEGPLAEGTVGEAYPSTVITATGQDDLAWSLATADAAVAGLPAGMELDPATGTLSGTPKATGAYEFTVQVTDVFGEDTRTYELTVVESDDPTDPTKPTDPTDPTKPTTPTDPATPGDPNGGGKGSQLSATGAASPLILGLLAAGVLAAGTTGVVIARKRAAGTN